MVSWVAEATKRLPVQSRQMRFVAIEPVLLKDPSRQSDTRKRWGWVVGAVGFEPTTR